MIAPLRHITYRRLFAAQVIALVGTGLATVALGLLAYSLAGKYAGVVLGTALAIKMIAYIGVAPVAGAVAGLLPRRVFLVALDVVRAGVVLLLPFVDQIWQVYVLIFVLQAASAAFTPTFQATIPDIVTDEREYTQALSLSRLAYDLESLLSPMLAALLLTVISFHWLFAGTAIGFAVSALLVLSVSLPRVRQAAEASSFLDRTTRGLRIYLATPRLRGLLALNLAAAAGGAMAIVNTVVFVRSLPGGTDTGVAVALGAFGAGSMIAAFALPRLLERLDDRTVMTTGAAGFVATLLALGVGVLAGALGWAGLLLGWLLMGLCYSSVLTPGGRLLRRSSHDADRPALFAAQFALSHACWLVTYPIAGWLGAAAGLAWAFFVLAGIAAFGVAAALALWPRHDPEVVAHVHADLPPDHPHLTDGEETADGMRHEHRLVIDRDHRRWPVRGTALTRGHVRTWLALFMVMTLCLLPVAHSAAAGSITDHPVTGKEQGGHHPAASEHGDDHVHDHDEHEAPAARTPWPFGHEHGHDHGGVDHAHELATAAMLACLHSVPVPRLAWRMPVVARLILDVGAGLERPPRSS